MGVGVNLTRVVFILVSAICGFAVSSVWGAEEGVWIGLVGGLLVGGGIVLLERSIHLAAMRRLFWGFSGMFAGVLSAGLVNVILGARYPFSLGLPVLFGYIGLMIGLRMEEDISFFIVGKKGAFSSNNKILDTSVIIDGRIADLCATGFLEGTFITPYFILQELQHIADSSDSLKRARGRRGLDILNRMRKMSEIDVRIVEEDFPQIREVDAKIVALAKKRNAKIVTNDLNLNKVAELQGVHVLNINELCNALKPVVLPGEAMRVFVLKEGKESGQGIAYLDDGTMIVVDEAKKMIGKNIDVVVTSVLQNTAGRMIFTKVKEGGEGHHPLPGEREEAHAVRTPNV